MLKTINYYSHSEFFQHIDTNTSVIITPNRRLSATLHKLYQQFQINLQKKCWITPDILPVFSWMQRLFSELTRHDFISHPLLLTSVQEQFLWENILTHAKESDFLLQLSETAELAKSAWSVLKQWQVDIAHPMFQRGEDYVAFHNWALEFQAICQNHDWIDSATLPNVIANHIKSGIINPPANIFLIGFTEFSPQLKHLLICCEEANCKINHLEIYRKQINARRISLIDQESEILTIARWAKSLSVKHKTATIGCVIPTLNKNRDRIKQVFSEVFAEDDSYTAQQQERPFNISAGKSLNQYPIIQAALHFLALHKKNIPLTSLSYLLTSPFLGEAETERTKRAHFDSLLRQANMNVIDVMKLIEGSHGMAKTNGESDLSFKKHCPALARRLRQFFSLLDKQNKTMSYRKSASLFNESLSILGWPGERSLNSEEYQIVENWLHFLADFMTLDHLSTDAPTIHQALQKLTKMGAKHTFQPESPEANVQVLGILEAGALPFDFLWIAGMDDLTWPPKPNPNPFIPKHLQRELHMPHATAERELLYCRKVTQQFKESASVTIFSHAEKHSDIILQKSPLICDLPELSIDQLSLLNYESKALRIYQSKSIEYYLDEKGPALLAQEKVEGGADLIKQQALCPFKAFATYRLKAKELESPVFGLRSKDRGIIVHKILELIWQKLQNHQTLCSMEESELKLTIEDAITTAINFHLRNQHVYTQYVELEKQRLLILIHDWLQFEKEREPFTVTTQETTVEITLNQLKLNLRIDRIDEICDGKKIIIDYKTGKNNTISRWFGNRLDEPQLPLYALIDPQTTIGIAFAQVSSSNHCFIGVSRFELDMKGVKLLTEIHQKTALSWDDQLNQWKTILTELSDDFSQGIAKVDPKDVQTCMWCRLKSLCRINESVC